MFVDVYTPKIKLNPYEKPNIPYLSRSISGPSPLLRRIRAQLIHETLSFYEPGMDKMMNLINDYIGADEGQEETIARVEDFFPIQSFFDELEIYKKKSMLRVEDRQHCVDWVRNIVSSQQEYAKLLPPFTIEQGNSKGITYVITKANKIYGYLYGTMHNFFPDYPEGKILCHLSPKTQLKLLQCSIIGTEVTIDGEPRFNSVEGALMRIAARCGIANIGIDDATYARHTVNHIFLVEGREDLPKTEKPKIKKFDMIEELNRYFKGAKDPRTLTRILMIAVHTGIVELAWSVLASENESEYQENLQKQRNQAMAENIHTLLNACEVIESEGSAKPPRCFFALGLSHIVPTEAIPESVVELLAKKGWGIAQLATRKIKMSLSRQMTPREVYKIGKLIEHMRLHPLYASQKITWEEC